jgi:hypothetical protein
MQGEENATIAIALSSNRLDSHCNASVAIVTQLLLPILSATIRLRSRPTLDSIRRQCGKPVMIFAGEDIQGFVFLRRYGCHVFTSQDSLNPVEAPMLFEKTGNYSLCSCTQLS